MRILLTGGAGFVGASLARCFREDDSRHEIVAFDNLHRAGSELNARRFAGEGIRFVHGDVRLPGDLMAAGGPFDVLIEASAEPSVHAGTQGDSVRYLLDTNLGGVLNCLEYARNHCGLLIFLSSSRVYSIPALRSICLEEGPSRLHPGPGDQPVGFSPHGVAEGFPVVDGFRSLYGATKLAGEIFLQEYAANFGLRCVTNRCGVLAGAGQFGKTDQGVFTLWVARHLFGGSLSYFGFGGKGLQVRDLLHPRDLFRLLQRQIDEAAKLGGDVYGVGGGQMGAVSLKEYTGLCQSATGRSLEVGARLETAAVDVPYFVTDHSRASARFGWRPEIGPAEIAREIATWLEAERPALTPLFQ